MTSYNNSNYSNGFFNLYGVYFDSTSQTNSNINIYELDISYLQKTGGTISNNLLINGSLDIQTSLTLPIGNIATLIGSNQLIIDGLQTTLTELDEQTSNHTIDIATNDNDISALQGRLNVEEPKTTALQILTSSHSTQISLNDTKINVLQGTLDTEELKIIDLQTLTASHTTNIASNTLNILNKQANITTSTSLSLDILTAKNLKSTNTTGTAELTIEGLGLNFDAYLDI